MTPSTPSPLTRRALAFALAAFASGCGNSSPSNAGAPGVSSGQAADDAASSGASSGQGSGTGEGGASAGLDAGNTSSGSPAAGDAGAADAHEGGAAPPVEAGTILAGDAGSCAPPAGVDANTLAAFNLVNQTRAAMGSPCATLVPALDTSAAKHCMYYAANQGSSNCIADPHVEVSGCMDFVAAQFSAREQDAGYTGRPNSETMAFSDNGASAVQQWIDSVWHRTPVLSPWTRDLGYGAATKCDTMDFGVGATSPSNLVVTYPYDGQIGVPTSFNGAYEGPTPPAPPSGWPSGYPVHVFAKGATITTHEFSVDGGAMLTHEWITSQTNSLAQNTVILYGDAPLKSATKYRVHVAGTGTGGAAIDVNIAFTTK
ncbi:MAG TPA: CAP domain-containing protein [Polyangiaceae bacterium]|nr:CAP domain-containing protein [Polyangiaceae bacterium]